MSNEKLRPFEKMAVYLKDNIAPDDIYLFAGQMIAVAALFQYGWSAKKVYDQELKTEPAVSRSAEQIIGLITSFEKDASIRIHFGAYEDNNTGETGAPSPG